MEVGNRASKLALGFRRSQPHADAMQSTCIALQKGLPLGNLGVKSFKGELMESLKADGPNIDLLSTDLSQ